MSATLTVPVPQVAYEALGGLAALERVLTVRIGVVRFPDGGAVTGGTIRRAFAVVHRVRGPALPTEVWNAKAKAWQARGSLDEQDAAGVPLMGDDATATWEGIALPAAGNPPFERAVAGYPQYRLCGAFTAQSAAIAAAAMTGLSDESAPFSFVSSADRARFGITLTPPSALDATQARFVIRNAAQQVTAYVDLDANGAVTLASAPAGGAAQATVVLQPGGGIELKPAAGKRVVVKGDLEVDHVSYLPTGGGPRKNL